VDSDKHPVDTGKHLVDSDKHPVDVICWTPHPENSRTDCCFPDAA